MPRIAPGEPNPGGGFPRRRKPWRGGIPELPQKPKIRPIPGRGGGRPGIPEQPKPPVIKPIPGRGGVIGRPIGKPVIRPKPGRGGQVWQDRKAAVIRRMRPGGGVPGGSPQTSRRQSPQLRNLVKQKELQQNLSRQREGQKVSKGKERQRMMRDMAIERRQAARASRR